MSRRHVLAALALVGAGATGSSSQTLPQNVPGYPTVAQVRVVNAARDEAVPVVLRTDAEPLPVAIAGVPSVALVPTTVIPVRIGRQLWEYRQVTVGATQDAAAVLNAAGADGWEAIGGTAGAAGTVWTLKRPR
ncbi:MAG: hypothetical protein IT184_13775 [Acidobacteria bacterium]|nr:hypothetical protein [Acidobacteriota bacterium]